ncbi:hypothetical protein SNE40_020746 [Patella caerulea]|uniref:AWS domain-containing protein n=2 Tax=Patella caerulea TaxID=87958 RepID=A0AAN8J4W9_PATCE
MHTSHLTDSNLVVNLNEEYMWLKHTKQVLDNSAPIETLNFTWAAYHAQNQSSKDIMVTSSALLPLFQESAHSVAMIKHSMDVIQDAVHHLNAGQIPIITVDQPLFALAKQIQWKWPEMYGEDLMVVMFGGLHIEMAVLKTIGDWLSGSGWTQALVQAGIAKSGTADSFLKASHVARTRRAHEVTAAALYHLQFQAYEKYTETAHDNGELPLVFETWCAAQKTLHPMFHYWDTVLELELCMLSFVRSLREGNFDLYKKSLTKLAPWFFALDHTNYARWIPVHLRDMCELVTKHPAVDEAFHSGNFTVRKTKRVFSAMPLDQGHEQNNACIKGDGGAVGLTDNPGALRRWMVAGPEVAQLIKQFELEALHEKKDMKTQHHEQTMSIQQSSVKNVSALIATISELVNPFEDDSKELVVLDTREIVTASATKSVYTAQSIGQNQLNRFTQERLIDRTTPIHNVISRNKLPLFVTSAPKPTNTSKNQLLSMKSDIDLFARLYIGCQTRDGNLEEFFCHENQPCPPSLSESGNLRLGKKCDLLKSLSDGIQVTSEAPAATCVILDGAVIVQVLKIGTTKTFDEYAKRVFVPHVMSKFQNASRLDLVWDRYMTNSLKDTARSKRGQGVRRRVVGTASLPTNWQSFLHVNTNKEELFKFLSQVLVQEYVQENGKELYVTEIDHVQSIPEKEDLLGISPCNHEEADTRILLHAAHAARNGHVKILIRTVDTDVVVLAVMISSAILQANTELWIAFGTGKHFRYLAAHEMSSSLGPEKSRALPMFHALTGCDTVSSFARHGKKSAWTAWNLVPDLTGALLTLATAPTCIPDKTFTTIERFVIKMYDKASMDTEINSARKTMFMKNNSLPGIPPTRAALEQHIKRATYQGGHVWGQTLIAQAELPSPTDWGWIRNDEGLYKPLWTTLPEAAKSCSELISCKCKKGCKNRCTCKKASLKCSPLCLCHGEC